MSQNEPFPLEQALLRAADLAAMPEAAFQHPLNPNVEIGDFCATASGWFAIV